MNYMSAFSSFQNHSFTLDSFVHPNTTPLFSQFYPCEHVDQIPVDICNNINEISENNHVNFTDHSSSVPTNNVPENGTKEQVVTNTKNKIKRKTSSVQLKDRKEVKAGNKRQRKKKISLSEDSTDQGINNKDEKKVLEEAPTGYIHVRARRGQATDSHSLAERVRREKISERMKVLQTLVPGCDKVTGKALMLDEIINYVQSLQHQVEFLSLRLASTNPTVYDFGMDMDTLMVNHERLNKLVSPILFSSMEKYNFALPLTLFEETTPHPYPQLFPQGHIITPDQENETGDKELAINLAASSFTNLWPFPLN